MKMYLYEKMSNLNNNNNEWKKRKDFEMALQFETKTKDFNNKQFEYRWDYDTRGIMYLIGTNYGTETWVNPAERGLVTLKSSEWEYGRIEDMVGRSVVFSYSSRKNNAWVSIGINDGLKIK
eukprot:111674_1